MLFRSLNSAPELVDILIAKTQLKLVATPLQTAEVVAMTNCAEGAKPGLITIAPILEAARFPANGRLYIEVDGQALATIDATFAQDPQVFLLQHCPTNDTPTVRFTLTASSQRFLLDNVYKPTIKTVDLSPGQSQTFDVLEGTMVRLSVFALER